MLGDGYGTTRAIWACITKTNNNNNTNKTAFRVDNINWWE